MRLPASMIVLAVSLLFGSWVSSVAVELPGTSPIRTPGSPALPAMPRFQDPPAISSATIEGKRLVVVGNNFSAGAVILIDGQTQRTKNSADSPSEVLIAKKGGKQIGRNQVVILQVVNSGDVVSGPFGFFGGPVITQADDGKTIVLSVGEQFLVSLGGGYDWNVDTTSLLPNVVGVPTLIGIPDSQGIFEPVTSGTYQLKAKGQPDCQKTDRDCPNQSTTFEVKLSIQ
jgi:hypothetical protein